MSIKTFRRLPLQDVLDNFPCMIATIPTKLKTAFLCSLAVCWEQDNWDYVPEHLIDDTLKMMPYMLDTGYGSDWCVELKDGEHGGVVRVIPKNWTRKDVMNSNRQKAKYDKPYWEDNEQFVAGCAICGKACDTVYEGEERLLVGVIMCPKCGRSFVDHEDYEDEESEEEDNYPSNTTLVPHHNPYTTIVVPKKKLNFKSKAPA